MDKKSLSSHYAQNNENVYVQRNEITEDTADIDRYQNNMSKILLYSYMHTIVSSNQEFHDVTIQ